MFSRKSSFVIVVQFFIDFIDDNLIDNIIDLYVYLDLVKN